MRRGSNNRETPKGVPSSKNNRQLVTCRPFRDSCMRTKPNSYRHGSYRLGSVYRQGSKTLFHAYGPRCLRCRNTGELEHDSVTDLETDCPLCILCVMLNVHKSHIRLIRDLGSGVGAMGEVGGGGGGLRRNSLSRAPTRKDRGGRGPQPEQYKC